MYSATWAHCLKMVSSWLSINMEDKTWRSCESRCVETLKELFNRCDENMLGGDILIKEEIGDISPTYLPCDACNDTRYSHKDVSYITEAGTFMHLNEMIETVNLLQVGNYMSKVDKLVERVGKLEADAAFAAWLNQAAAGTAA